MRKQRPQRVQRPKPPLAAAMALQAALRARVERFAARVKAEVLDKWRTNRKATRAAHRVDASPWIEAKLRHLRADLEHDHPTVDLEVAAKATATQNMRESRRLIPESLRKDPHIGPQIDGFRRAAMAKIVELDKYTISDLRDVLEEHETKGSRVEDLAKDIEDRLGVSSSKAELLARDQTMKLNAAITKERQTASGISEYVWSGSLDEREREMHVDLEGEKFSWDDPPVTNEEGDRNHPGEDYQCRCVAIPVIPDLPDVD